MVIKEKFILLKDVPNILHLDKSTIEKYSVDNGVYMISNILNILSKNIDHYTKSKVLEQISTPEKLKEIAVLNYPLYPLNVSYNVPTKQIVINISPFNVNTITVMSPDPRNLYSSMVYGIGFRNLILGKLSKIKESYFSVFSTFITSMLVQMVGREYGLLGKYSNQINMLKFLTGCYILDSFYGISGEKGYQLSSRTSMLDYRKYKDELSPYDLSNIENYIKALSDLKVLPGITKYHFTSKIFKFLGISFLPAMEDISRFLAIFCCSSVPGSSMVSRHLEKYNDDVYSDIIDISKVAF